MQLYVDRIDAACVEHGTSFEEMKTVFNDAGIGLTRRVTQDLAIWEPRTFRVSN